MILVFGDTSTYDYNLVQFIDSLSNNDTIKIKEKLMMDPLKKICNRIDLEGSMDNRKLLFQMGWNISLTNNNIWSGVASKDSLDLLMDTIPDGKFGKL